MSLTKMLELTIKSREDQLASIELEDMIKNLITEQEMKSKGRLDLYKSVKKYIDRLKKEDPSRELLHGVRFEEGKTYFSNTFSLFRINQQIIGFEQVKMYDSALKMIDDTKENNSIEVKIPSLPELKSLLKIAKAAKRATKAKSISVVPQGKYNIANDTYVDIELLTEAVEILGEISYASISENSNSPVYLQGKEGEAIIMPLRS